MPSGYQGYSPTDYARSMATTLAKHVRSEEETWMRNFQILALLMQNGQIEYNVSGRGIDWPVRYKRANSEGNTGETPRSFARVNRHLMAALQRRGYQSTDSIYKGEMVENRGEEAIVKVYENMVSNLEKDMKQRLATEVYVDGSATGYETNWNGFESMFAIDGTVNISTGAKQAANAADRVGYPSDTYATLSTVLGAYGGSNESGVVWPLGVADPEFDHWSPIVLNAKSTDYAASTHTWAGQGDEVMRYGLLMAARNSSLEGQITNFILDRMMFADLKNLFDNKEQINITSEMGLRALGFTNTMIFDGAEVSFEAGIPSGVGYGFNWRCIELKSWTPGGGLFETEGPEYDIDSQSYKAVVSTLSNLKFSSPRNFIKIANLT